MKPDDEVLGFRVRAVGDHLLLAADDLARALERLAALLEVAVRFQLAHPRHPALHALLRALRRAHRFALRRRR